ncbi:Soluble lytic murein transglycosylase precursor [Candidatus Cyrtobacter comes]|uniref:Soluble lytic murein transglycosylase n=1 Tax=Candidatus Cyrtobacter comes TaxID=675776 RepID=A0ABU5L8I4_9RICK|nr:lytic transglycosylase domain-containing protein [Candidatus Cyrtobacter comes]MDZ5762205.1 Soluble lytic murein transglycosylase precursor [Candidatus Cyrtobacter comes]
MLIVYFRILLFLPCLCFAQICLKPIEKTNIISEKEYGLLMEFADGRGNFKNYSIIQILLNNPAIFNVMKCEIISQINFKLDLNSLKKWAKLYNHPGSKIDLIISIKSSKAPNFNKIQTLWKDRIYDKEFEDYIASNYITKFSKSAIKEKILLLLRAGKYQIATKLINNLSKKESTIYNNLIDTSSCKSDLQLNYLNNKKILEISEYAHIHCLFKAHKNELAITALKKLIQGDYNRKHFARLKLIAARLLMKKNPQEALSFLDNSSHIGHIGSMDESFLSGFINFTYIKDYDRAALHFNNMLTQSKLSSYKSHAMYWLARSYSALGDKEKAKKLFKRNASLYPTFFYGQMSIAELGEDINIYLNKNLINLSSKETSEQKAFSNQQINIINTAQLLLERGFLQKALILMDKITYKKELKQSIKDLIQCLSKNGNASLLTIISKQFANYGYGIIKEGYPINSSCTGNFQRLLSLAIIREESSFTKGAKSEAGAMGIMQILPSVASKFGIDINLFEESHNMKVGCQHIKELSEFFNNDKILIASAYNAGKSSPLRWIKDNGPLKNDIHSMINWIEEITYAETRFYVKRVLENYTIYEILARSSNETTT